MSRDIFRAGAGMGRRVEGRALVAKDGFSARYDLDRRRGIFSRPEHKLAGESFVGRVLVLEDPTAGVDVGAKAEIYRLLGRAVEQGLAVLLVSTDFEEVAQICHRALVFRNGRIVAELAEAALSVEALVHAASLADDRNPGENGCRH